MPRLALLFFTMPRLALLFFTIALAVLGMGVCALAAHPADESGLRVRVEPDKLEVRLTFNILTLARFVTLDANGDGLLGISELDGAQDGLAHYLNEHVHVQINKQPQWLGADVEFEYLWPEPRATPPMTEPEYSARNVDVTFIIPVESRVLESVWIEFDFFEQTGPTQTIRGQFEQDAQVTEVQFSAQKPEYAYDTGYAKDPFLQEAEKKRQSAAKGAEPEQAGNRRWWMVRVFVLIVLIVLGRHATLAKRARRLPTRRGRRS